MKNKLMTENQKDKYIKQLEQENEVLTEQLACLNAQSKCSICKYYLCVSSDGDTFPCAGWPNYKLGNLKDTSISEIWENSKKRQIILGNVLFDNLALYGYLGSYVFIILMLDFIKGNNFLLVLNAQIFHQ